MNQRIAWLIPFPIKGSGGHRTIFSHIRNLIDRGHTCHVYIGDEENKNLQPSALQQIVSEYFGPCSASLYSGYQVTEHYDLAIATAWWTAPVVADQVQARHKIYFIQDFEPWFNPMGDNFILAENTYRLGLAPVTIGRWLSRIMLDLYNTPASFFEFTADKTIYHPLNTIKKEKALCFVYQPEKPRRCPAIGRETLALVSYHCPEIKIYTYGSEETPGFSFKHTHLGILSLKECNKLYNRCKVGLCLSASNPSRIPFEMMAAGLPVVDFYSDNTIYDMPDKGVLLAERTPASIAGALLKILASDELQLSMRNASLDFMQHRQADQEFDQCANIIESIMAGTKLYPKTILPHYTAPAYRCKITSPPPDIGYSFPEKPTKKNLMYWFRNNRLSRALKVLLRGYY